MSVGIDVYRREDAELLDNPPGVDAIDRWLEELDRRRLFGATIGSQGEVGVLWGKPGKRLGLVLVQSFMEGTILIEGPDLDVLDHEMSVLEDDWLTSIGDEVKTWSYVSDHRERSFTVPLFFLLVQRASYVLTATRIARRVGGFVDIGEQSSTATRSRPERPGHRNTSTIRSHRSGVTNVSPASSDRYSRTVRPSSHAARHSRRSSRCRSRAHHLRVSGQRRYRFEA